MQEGGAWQDMSLPVSGLPARGWGCRAWKGEVGACGVGRSVHFLSGYLLLLRLL